MWDALTHRRPSVDGGLVKPPFTYWRIINYMQNVSFFQSRVYAVITEKYVANLFK